MNFFPIAVLLPDFRSLFSVLDSQLEQALQAAPWCHGAGDSKSADVPLGGERPRGYLLPFIMYKFDVQLPFEYGEKFRICLEMIRR